MLRIKNATGYDTEQIRALVVAWCRQSGAQLTTVRVVYARNGGMGGYAYLGRPFVHLRVPRAFLPTSKLAQLIEHEGAHTLGLDHRDLDRGVNVLSQPTPWVPADMPAILHERATCAEPPARVDRVAQREAHAREMLVRAETRLRRAQTLLRRWRARVRYYERRIAKAAARSKP